MGQEPLSQQVLGRDLAAVGQGMTFSHRGEERLAPQGQALQPFEAGHALHDRHVHLAPAPGRIRQAVRRREVDVAIVQGMAGLEGLERLPLWREPLLAAMAERHPLAHGSEVAAEDLLRQRFLAHGGAGEHALQTALIAAFLGQPPRDLDCLPVDRETLLELTSLGLGVTLIPGSAAAVFHPGVAYRLISGAEASVSFRAVWKAGGTNPALGPFIAQARALALRGAAPGS